MGLKTPRKDHEQDAEDHRDRRPHLHPHHPREPARQRAGVEELPLQLQVPGRARAQALPRLPPLGAADGSDRQGEGRGERAGSGRSEGLEGARDERAPRDLPRRGEASPLGEGYRQWKAGGDRLDGAINHVL